MQQKWTNFSAIFFSENSSLKFKPNFDWSKYVFILKISLIFLFSGGILKISITSK